MCPTVTSSEYYLSLKLMIVYVLTEPAQPLSLQFILAIVLVATHHYDDSKDMI